MSGLVIKVVEIKQKVWKRQDIKLRWSLLEKKVAGSLWGDAIRFGLR